MYICPLGGFASSSAVLNVCVTTQDLFWRALGSDFLHTALYSATNCTQSPIFCHEYLHAEPCILPQTPHRVLHSATKCAQSFIFCHEYLHTQPYILPQTTYRALYSATNSTQSRRFCHEHRVNQPYILPRTPHWAICSVLQCVALLQCLVVWCRVYILPSTSRQRALPRTHSPWQNSGLCVETQGSAISFSFCSFFCSSRAWLFSRHLLSLGAPPSLAMTAAVQTISVEGDAYAAQFVSFFFLRFFWRAMHCASKFAY